MGFHGFSYVVVVDVLGVSRGFKRALAFPPTLPHRNMHISVPVAGPRSVLSKVPTTEAGGALLLISLIGQRRRRQPKPARVRNDSVKSDTGCTQAVFVQCGRALTGCLCGRALTGCLCRTHAASPVFECRSPA